MIIVAGCHRSGTSAMAQLLHRVGLFMGDDLMGSNDFNQHGHVEDLDVVSIHERLLADNGVDWKLTDDLLPLVTDDVWQTMARFVARRSFTHREWGFKDPRATLFLALWRHLVPDAKVIAIIRRPEDVVSSLERRHHRIVMESGSLHPENLRFWTESDLGIRLWLTYNRALARSLSLFGDDAMIVRFEDLERPADIVDNVRSRWGVDLAIESLGQTWHAESVNVAGSTLVVHDSQLGHQAEDLYQRLVAEAIETTEAIDGGQPALPRSTARTVSC